MPLQTRRARESTRKREQEKFTPATVSRFDVAQWPHPDSQPTYRASRFGEDAAHWRRPAQQRPDEVSRYGEAAQRRHLPAQRLGDAVSRYDAPIEPLHVVRTAPPQRVHPPVPITSSFFGFATGADSNSTMLVAPPASASQIVKEAIAKAMLPISQPQRVNYGMQAMPSVSIGTDADFTEMVAPPAPVLSEEMTTLIAEMKVQEDKLDLVPTFIRCICGRDDLLSNMFDCFTCSEYGLCSMCTLKGHRMHEFRESKPNVIHNVVKDCSDSSLDQLTKWARDMKHLLEKGGESYSELCVLLGSAFKNASENGNTRCVEELMAACDVNILQDDVVNMMEANVKMIESVRKLCENLKRRYQSDQG